MAKRLDLQELRGIFILQVLFFHFFPSYAPNGYVGVDEFFVLSGYFIAVILCRPSDSFKEQILNFYYSRIKRILPAYALFIFLSLISLYIIFPPSNIDINMNSVYSAIFFFRNHLGTNQEKAYSAMLSLAQDIYTHTWSLAVEIQFYCLAPFVFVLKKCSPSKFPFIISFMISASLLFHLNSPQNIAFNSVFGRIWQFFAGSSVHLYQQRDESTSYIPLVKEGGDKTFGGPPAFFQKMLFFSVFLLGYFPFELEANILRILTTTIVCLLILEGKSTSPNVLSKAFIYLGDISYILYLVHWPVYVFLHLNHHLKFCHLTIGLLFSIKLSIILHELYEKKYLTFDRKQILNLLLFLYMAIACLILNNQHLRSYVYGKESEFGYEFPPNITKHEAIKLNRDYLLGDFKNVFHPNCSYIDGPGPFNHCIMNGSESRQEVMMVIGNSYAPNNIHPLYEYCSDKFKKTVMYAVPACEVLYDTTLHGYSCNGQTERFINETASYNPDVLVMYTRHLTIMPKVMPTAAEEKQSQKIIENFLEQHEKNVKRKIFILDALPRPSGDVTRLVNDGLHFSNSTSRMVVQQKLLEDVALWQLTRSRLRKAVEKCSKCHLIDYLDIFTDKNNIFQFYDIKTGVTYFNSGRHLTPYGLHQVRPFYKKLCENI